MPPQSDEPPPPSLSARLRRIVPRLAGLVALILVADLATAAFVGVKAHLHADGEAYCIAVPDDDLGGYRPADSWLRLTLPRLQSQPGFGGLYLQFHAVLVVDDAHAGRRVANWSWRDLDFHPGRVEQANALLWPDRRECPPQVDFIAALSLL